MKGLACRYKLNEYTIEDFLNPNLLEWISLLLKQAIWKEEDLRVYLRFE